MWIDLTTNKTYTNRLDCKLAVGSGRFNRMLKNKEVIYITDEVREQIKNN